MNKKFTMIVDESFMDDLLRYDFVSKVKGKKLGNLLLEKKRGIATKVTK